MRWLWSTARPALIFVGLIGVLAAWCMDLGTQFRFPGTDRCYPSLRSATDFGLLFPRLCICAKPMQARMHSSTSPA